MNILSPSLSYSQWLPYATLGWIIHYIYFYVVVVQSTSYVLHFVIPWTAPMPGLSVPHYLLEFAQVHVHYISDTIHHLILWCPLLLPSIFPRIRNFSSELSVHIRWPKYWNFSFKDQSFSDYSGLISLKIDWFDLLAVQGTFKSLLQHHSSKASIPWCSAFFTVLLSQPYVTTGKTIALTIQTFVGRGMSQLFNSLPRFVISFLPRSSCLLISWSQSPSAV